MEIGYKRDLNQNHMTIKGDTISDADDYQIKMLMENSIEGFLRVELRIIEREIIFYYDISGKQTIQQYYEHKTISYGDLKAILFGIHNALLCGSRYLIEERHIILDPNYIYINPENLHLSLVFFTEHDKDIKESFRCFADHILLNIDHKEDKAVILAYQLYKITREENYTLEEILAIAVENQSSMDDSENIIMIDKDGRNYLSEDLDELEKNNERNSETYYEKNGEENKKNQITNKNIINLCVAASAGFGSFLCFLCSVILFQLSYKESLIMVGVAAMIVVTAILVILFNNKKTVNFEYDVIEKKVEDEIHYIDFFGQNEFQH